MDPANQLPPAGAPPITTQPQGSGIVVRNMVAEDADFAGRLSVEAFEAKFEWAVGKKNMEGVKRAMADITRLNPKDFARSFVATYEGKPAGLIVLAFHGDGEPTMVDSITDYISCCGAIGLCCLEMSIGNESAPQDHCYVEYICVDSQFRGKGIGKALMDVADDQARQKGCHTIYLYATNDNRAKNLYERQGYQVTDVRDGCCMTWCAVGKRHFCKMVKTL